MKKNVAGQFASGEMISSTDGSDFTGSVTCYVTGDNGTQTLGSVGSGACTHKGNGLHTYTPAQAETNYNHIVFTFKGTGAVTASPQVYTSFPQTVDNATALTNIQGRIPAALVSGRIDASTGAMASGTLTAAAIAASALNGKGDWNIGKTGYSSDIVSISGSTSAADNLEGHALRAVPVTFSGGTTTTAILVNVDGAAASSTNDVYNGRVLVFSAPAGLKDQACSITAYNGATKTATISAVTTAVTGSAAAVLA